MKKQLLIMALFLVMGAPAAWSQEGDDASAPAAHKSVRDMSPEERRAFWEQLPEEDRQRILEARQARMKVRAQNAPKDGLPQAGGAPQPKAVNKAPPRYEDLPEDRQQRAKAAWEAMSPEERRAFVLEHKDAILSGRAARGN